MTKHKVRVVVSLDYNVKQLTLTPMLEEDAETLKRILESHYRCTIIID